MAKSVTLKDQEGNELYPVTDIDLVNGTVPTAKIASSAVTSAKLASSAVTTAKIADSAVTSAKLSKSDLWSTGQWILIDSAYLSANSTGTSFLKLDIPSAYQFTSDSNGAEYKLVGGFEVTSSNLPQYPALFAWTSAGIQAGNINFCYMKDEANGSARYANNSVNAFGFEWHVVNNNESCTFEVQVGKAGLTNFWNAWSRAGGQSNGYASTFSGAARTQWKTAITGFSIGCGATSTLLVGSHMSLYARKTNVTGGIV